MIASWPWPNATEWPEIGPSVDPVVPEVDDLADPEPELLDHRGDAAPCVRALVRHASRAPHPSGSGAVRGVGCPRRAGLALAPHGDRMRLDVLLDLLQIAASQACRATPCTVTSLTLHLAERDGQLVAAAVFEADATYQSGEYLIAA